MANFQKLIESMNQIAAESWEDDEAADRAAFDMQPKTNICPDCEGGRYDPEGECETCGGAGEIFEDGIEEGRDVRENTISLLQLMDEGVMDPRTVADAALSYMSESEVTDMIRANDWGFADEDDYEDDEDDDDEYVIPNESVEDEDYLGEDPWGLGQ